MIKNIKVKKLIQSQLLSILEIECKSKNININDYYGNIVKFTLYQSFIEYEYNILENTFIICKSGIYTMIKK